jgi:SNF2 family DNA or RNA helicase
MTRLDRGMKVWHDEERGKIYGRTAWVDRAYELCKTIGGCQYDIRRQIVVWPLTMGTCQRLRETFPDLKVDPGLIAWARAQRRRSIAIAEAGLVGQVAPQLAAAIAERPYQVDGVHRLAATSRMLLADEPGLGKTIQALGALIESGNWHGRHLVIAPKTAIMPTWTRQIIEWTGGQVFPAIGDLTQKKKAIAQFLAAGEGARFLLTNPETLRVQMDRFCPKCGEWLDVVRNEPRHAGQKGHRESWQIRQQKHPELFGVSWDTIIADECDRYLLGLRPQTGKMPDWAEGMIRLGADRKYAMTGTPFHGKEINLFGILHWLDPKRFSAFWTHVDTYFEQKDNGYGIEIVGIHPDKREIYLELLDQYMLRRTKLEVRADLPAEIHINHFIEMGPGQHGQYHKFEKLGWTRLDDGSAVRSMGVLSAIIRLKQLAFGAMMIRGDKIVPYKSAKLEWLMAALSERGIKVQGMQSGEMKYVVVSQFTQHLNWIEGELNRANISTLKITGEVVGKARDEAQANFQSPGGPRVMLLNTVAGGVSIDLDAWCDEMFILDETDVEDQMEQVRGRINNRGARIAPRTYHYLRCIDTIDERLADANLRQAIMQHGLLDGPRGLELAARLMGRDA